MTRLRLICVTTFAAGLLAIESSAIPWPVHADSAIHRIGNSYGEFQYYGGAPYYHPGIDIMVPAGTPVYAVKAGYVKAVLTTSADLHWRVAIGDSAEASVCDGWLYAHLELNSIAVVEGEFVQQGQFLGNIVSWSIAGFHHLHFVKIRDVGVVWNAGWEFIGNPLDELEGIADMDAPVFEEAVIGRRFAFSRNGASVYFAGGTPISGDVDIICRVYDYINHYGWKLAPYSLEYKIDGDTSIPWTTTVTFTGLLDYTNNVGVAYRDDATCDSRGDYSDRWFFFNLTNTDGDGIIEPGDAGQSWQTANFTNGEYTITARASDRFGHSATTTMNVTVENFFALSGDVSCSDGNPDLRGAVVIFPATGAADTTIAEGLYAIPIAPGGKQALHISRLGYISLDTIVMMNQSQSLTFVLDPEIFTRGEANHDGAINVGDIVYLINFIFKGGPSPSPLLAGDANSDGVVNIGDAVYLVNYVFKGGPPPVA